MAMVNFVLLSLVAIFPYSPWMFAEAVGKDPWIAVLWFWAADLAAAIALLMTRKGWSARRQARATMWVKLVQIPAYVMWFVLGAALFLFMGPLLAFLVDAMTIIVSGLVGLGTVFRCRKEGILTGKQTVTHGILQFVFCADVVSAIILYRKTKEVSP